MPGLHDVAGLDAAADQRAVDGRADDRLVETRLRRVAASRAPATAPSVRQVHRCRRDVGLDLQPRRRELALGDVEVALRVVERRLADEALRLEVQRPVVLLFRRERRLASACGERLLGRRQTDFAHLPDPGLGLRDRGLCLRNRRALVAIVEHDQDVATLDALTFVDRNAGDAFGDHRADRHALRRRDAAARDDGLHEVAANDVGDVDRRAEDGVTEDERGDREHCGRDQRPLRPGATQESCAVGRVEAPARRLWQGHG